MTRALETSTPGAKNYTMGHHGTHLETLVNEAISPLAPYSAMILTVCAVVVFLLRLYFFEGFLVKTKLYRDKYNVLSEDQKRSFLNHHIAGSIKFVLLVTAAYPFLGVTFGKATPHTPISGGHPGPGKITMGDLMIVCSNLFTVMYIFELYYRKNVSPISGAHHIGAIIIAQTAIAISLNFDRETDAVYEFVMCFVWGAFDILAEIWPHITMIIYRLKPNDHLLLSRLFFSTACLEITGTVLETIVVFWLWGSVWTRWSLSFKIVTPILHLLFSCAQLWGAWVFRQLWLSEKAKYEKYQNEQHKSMVMSHPADAEGSFTSSKTNVTAIAIAV